MELRVQMPERNKFQIGGRTLIMGILNVTPDSFSDGGKFFSFDKALEHAEKLISEGADIIDVGGESTKPGSEPIRLEEELRRVIPVIEKIADKIPVSIDTQKAEVARRAVDLGARVINDVSAMRNDKEMAGVAAQYGAYVVLMHMKGMPKDMQKAPEYLDVVGEIKDFFSERINYARAAGIKTENIILDPGIGFGKTLKNNLDILKNFKEFKKLGCCLMAGVSRKSFIGTLLDKKPDERIFGTAGAVSCAVMNGADIVRVHDVAQIKDAVRIIDAVNCREA